MNNNYCVIMAGGVGSRFWPISKTSRPKQFLDILGTGKTFIQMTYERFRKIIPADNFYVVTSSDYKDMVMEQLSEIKEEQVLLEPLRRNTAPCIAYASYKIHAINPNATIIVAPSDHLILKEDEFVRQISNGIKVASEESVLLTLGITPSRPETGYGYIQIDSSVENQQLENLYKVKTFTEKPDLKMAEVFVNSGEFFWNSGMFIWSVKAIMNALDKHLEEVSTLFKRGKELYGTSDEKAFLNKTYSECSNISIDYGVMEKADNVFVLCADFGWSDLGTWGSLYENREKDENQNVLNGDHILTYKTTNCIVDTSDERLVVLQGLDGYIVVESEGTLMVCRREDEQQIRQIVNDVKMNVGDKFV